MIDRRRLAFVASLAGLLGACSAMTPPAANPQVPPPGPEAFRAGYVDGCQTGFGEAGREGYQSVIREDPRRYSGDAEYKRGFDRGRAACYAEEQRHPKVSPGPETG